MAINGGNPDPHDNTGESREASPCPLCGTPVFNTGYHIRVECDGHD